MDWIKELEKLGACREALEWCRKCGFTSLADAWAACERGDWMLWLIGRLAGEPGSDARRTLVLAACDCAELARAYVPEARRAVVWPVFDAALATARSWARNEGASLTDVRAAARAAAAAAAAAAYAAYAAAAYAAAYAAYDAAYDAAYAAAAVGARAHALRQCAEIVRRYYPAPPEVGA